MRIGVCDDEKNIRELISNKIKKEYPNSEIFFFKSGEELLLDSKDIDILLLDIQMPGIDGMKASYELRKIDKTVSIIFITSMVQFAQKGYEVNAVSFMLKPINYYDFSLKLKKALDISTMNENRNITINTKNGICRISTDKIIYVEIIKHKLVYHLVDELIEMTGVLSEVESRLNEYGFLRCNQCYLVNPKYIVAVKGKELIIGNETLQISRPRYNQFMKDLTNWFAGRLNV